MKRAAKLLLLVPIVIIAVAIAVANRHRVTFSLDPFAEANPALSIDLPLYWLLVGALILGVLLGGIATWFRQGKWRKAARRDHAELERAKRAADRNRPPTALPSPAERS